MRFLELGIITPHKIAGVAIDWAAFCMPTNKQCRWWRPEWKELVERKKLVERVQLQSYGIRLQCTQEVGALLSLFVCKCSFVSCRIGILVWKSCCWVEHIMASCMNLASIVLCKCPKEKPSWMIILFPWHLTTSTWWGSHPPYLRAKFFFDKMLLPCNLCFATSAFVNGGENHIV
jgi:hypothetical protein